MFCANCVIQHWHVKTSNMLHSSIPCPICRQTVTMILPVFTLDSETLNNPINRPIILNINKYNKKFSGMPRSIMDYIYDLPTLLRHSFVALFSLDGLAVWYRVRVVFLVIFALTYLLSPFDLIPETVFGLFGFIDDILLFFFLAVYITIIYRQIVANRG
jgi:RING finger protein 170